MKYYSTLSFLKSWKNYSNDEYVLNYFTHLYGNLKLIAPKTIFNPKNYKFCIMLLAKQIWFNALLLWRFKHHFLQYHAILSTASSAQTFLARTLMHSNIQYIFFVKQTLSTNRNQTKPGSFHQVLEGRKADTVAQTASYIY